MLSVQMVMRAFQATKLLDALEQKRREVVSSSFYEHIFCYLTCFPFSHYLCIFLSISPFIMYFVYIFSLKFRASRFGFEVYVQLGFAAMIHRRVMPETDERKVLARLQQVRSPSIHLMHSTGISN